MYAVIPKPEIWGDTVLVSTPTKTYSAKQYEQLFTDLGIPDSYQKFKAVLDMNPNYPAPNVPTVCTYGSGGCTPKKLVYEHDFNGTSPDGISPRVVYGDGDGIVNVENALVCRAWESMKPKYDFSYREREGYPHTQGCGRELTVGEIAKVVYSSKLED